QLPMFGYFGGEGDPAFTTFRNAQAFGLGVHTFQNVELIGSSSGDVSVANSEELLARLQEDLDEYGDVYDILGVGFTGSEGAVINSISFAGDTYYVGPGACLPEQEQPGGGEDDDDEDGTGGGQPPAPKRPVAVDTGL